jgi:hypothetical protein
MRFYHGSDSDGNASLPKWWTLAKQATPKQLRKGLASATLLVPWMIWKQRNECAFDSTEPPITNLVAKIID